jgi:hypothetical protein
MIKKSTRSVSFLLFLSKTLNNSSIFSNRYLHHLCTRFNLCDNFQKLSQPMEVFVVVMDERRILYFYIDFDRSVKLGQQYLNLLHLRRLNRMHHRRSIRTEDAFLLEFNTLSVAVLLVILLVLIAEGLYICIIGIPWKHFDPG